ncbi:hypothetical protein [Lactiplantibacillus carotarum]|uniref:hypothetical protein n=1 Tax=Lactiplantibacillus carotarum TaxID=2993456 RepID=UPI00298F0CF1|nr:hypothetical protein [Lactiplantibacillus carotarum]
MAHFFSTAFLWLFCALGLIIIVGHWITVHVFDHEPIFSKRGLKYGGIVYFIVVMLIGGWIDDLGKPKTSTSTAAKSEQVAKSKPAAAKAKSKSKKAKEQLDARDTLVKMSTQQISDFNVKLAANLQESHDFANAGSDGYTPHTYLTSLEYDQQRGLQANVRPEFLQLSKAQRESIANLAQNIVVSELFILGHDLPTTGNHLYTTIYLNDEKIATSRLTNTTKYKWRE